MNDSNVIYLKFENDSVPEFKEVKNKDYIYFGDNNTYPDHLIDLYLKCAKHNAIVNGKCNYIYAAGLTIDDDNANVEQRAKADKFISLWEPFAHDMIKDFELFNSIAIEVIYDKRGKDIADFAYMPMSKIRTNADESLYFYSNDWKQKNQSEEKTGYKELKPFDLENPGKNQLYVFKVKSPKNGVEKNVYGIPNYIGSVNAILTDIEIGNYHLNNIKSGFSAGQIISFNNGVPTEEAKKQIERQIKQKHTGTEKAGGLVITFNNSQDNAPTIQNFNPNDLDKQFIEISKRINQEIYTSHNVVSPVLFGVATEGALGQRNEMVDAYELFQYTYVNVRQTLLEKVINNFAELFGIVNRIYFKKVSPVKSNLPDSVIQKAYDTLDTTELRELVGLPKKKVQFKLDIEPDIYEVLFERQYTGQSDEDAIICFQKENFADVLKPNEKSIVDLLGKDVLTPSDAIAKVLKISVADVNKIIDDLTKRGYIASSGNPTVKGDKASVDSKTDNIEVKYRYGWRPDVKPDNNAREFCKEMLSKTKSQKNWMSRSEIENLDNGQDLSVWDSRGGWWNKNGANVPYCRHDWFQVVVKRK